MFKMDSGAIFWISADVQAYYFDLLSTGLKFCLFVLMFYIPVNSFFSHVRMISCLPGLTQY